MEKKKSPHIINAEPGTYAFCSCGQSKNLPHCDGSHKGSEHTPVIENITEEKIIAICSCGNSKNGVYCDGSHKNTNR